MYVPVIPITGLGGLRFLEETEETQLNALTSDAEVSRATEYFKQNIASATSSDALLADRRLLEVALTAYGLESEIGKTAFIKRVLDEGTENEDSMANRLNDQRWTAFAKAFGYGNASSGGRVSSFQAAIELRFRDDGEADPYENAISAADLATFRANIDSINSIEDLLADPVVLDVAMKAYGLERGFYTDDHFRTLLTEGSTGAYANGLKPLTWKSFAKAFKGLGDGQPAQTYADFEMRIAREFERRGKSPISSQADANLDPARVSQAEFNAFALAVSAAPDAATALANDDVLKVTRAAFNIADDVSDADARAILTAAAAGDMSLASAQLSTDWTLAAEALQAAFQGGVKQFVGGPQYNIELNLAADELEALDYLLPEPEPLPEVDAAELEYFRSKIGDIEDAASLVADARVLDVALRAFGLENEGRSASFIQRILEEDPADPTAYVNIATDQRWVDFIQAFQGPAAGESAQPDVWRFELEEKLIALGAPEEDLAYLRSNWNLIDESLDLMLDPKLLDIVVSAFGLPKDAYTSGFVLNMLIADPSNPRSLPRVLGDERWVEFAEFFGASRGEGNVGRDNFQSDLINRYHRQLFETQVGTVDQSLRIALNFTRQIANIANSSNVAASGWLQIMGDQPMRTVLDGAFGLPSQFAQLDFEAQQRVYEARSASLFGGSDPSVFLDPANVTKALDLYLGRSAFASSNTTPGYLTLIGQSVTLARSINQTF